MEEEAAEQEDKTVKMLEVQAAVVLAVTQVTAVMVLVDMDRVQHKQVLLVLVAAEEVAVKEILMKAAEAAEVELVFMDQVPMELVD